MEGDWFNVFLGFLNLKIRLYGKWNVERQGTYLSFLLRSLLFFFLALLKVFIIILRLHKGGEEIVKNAKEFVRLHNGSIFAKETNSTIKSAK